MSKHFGSKTSVVGHRPPAPDGQVEGEETTSMGYHRATGGFP